MIETDGIAIVNDRCYIDLESHIVAIQFDRVTFTVHVEEFLDFFNSIDSVREYLINSDSYVVGTTMQGEREEIIVPKPTDEECS